MNKAVMPDIMAAATIAMKMIFTMIAKGFFPNFMLMLRLFCSLVF